MSRPLLKLDGVAKTYQSGAGREIRALDDVTLEIGAGDIVLLTGANGSGKSTMLNVVAGLERPDRGRIVLRGSDVTSQPAHMRAREVTYIRQQRAANLVATLSVADVLMLAATVNESWWRPLLWRRMRQQVELVASDGARALLDRPQTPVLALSGGQHQMLALLASLAMIKGGRHFSIFLFDEHMSNLDPEATARVLELTRTIAQQKGTATIVVAHGIDPADLGATRIITLGAGRCLGDERHGPQSNSGLTLGQ